MKYGAEFRFLFAISTFVAGVSVGVIGQTPAAGASVRSVAGTYEASIFGDSVVPMTLLANHTVAFPPSAPTLHWHLRSGILKISGSIGPAPPEICLNFGQPEQCDYRALYRGRETKDGIASEARPGTAIGFVGDAIVETGGFWATRSGST